jgi:hypothetical protein
MSVPPATTISEEQLIIVRADQIVTKRMRWLWSRRIPLGSITTFAGLPGEGKSLIVADIVARLTKRLQFPDGESSLDVPGDALIISGEDDPATALVPRLTAAGADLSRIQLVKSVVRPTDKCEREVRLDLDAKKIRDALRADPAIRLVAFDPVTDSLGGVQMYKEQDIRSLLRPLRYKDIAVLLVAHLNKKEGLAAIHRVGGAGAFIGLARASWLFATNAETKQRQMLSLKNNYAARSTPGLAFDLEEVTINIEGKDELIPRVKWLGESGTDANDILDASTIRAEAKAAAMEFLKEFLDAGSQEATAVERAAQEQGISCRTLYRAKAELHVASFKDGQKWMWSL